MVRIRKQFLRYVIIVKVSRITKKWFIQCNAGDSWRQKSESNGYDQQGKAGVRRKIILN